MKGCCHCPAHATDERFGPKAVWLARSMLSGVMILNLGATSVELPLVATYDSYIILWEFEVGYTGNWWSLYIILQHGAIRMLRLRNCHLFMAPDFASTESGGKIQKRTRRCQGIWCGYNRYSKVSAWIGLDFLWPGFNQWPLGLPIFVSISITNDWNFNRYLNHLYIIYKYNQY